MWCMAGLEALNVHTKRHHFKMRLDYVLKLWPNHSRLNSEHNWEDINRREENL